MNIPRRMKKFFLIGVLCGLVFLLAARLWLWTALLGLALLVWLSFETRFRTRFRFMDPSADEQGLRMDAEVLDVRCTGSAIFVHPLSAITVQSFERRPGYRRVFEKAPLDLLTLPDGSLVCAEETRLTLSDAEGRHLRSLDFDPPLLRQGYRLVLGPDAAGAVLLTPWFAQVFDVDLLRLRGRVRFEDAGHYFKYAALGPQGRGLLLGGAYLVAEEEGGALEARWDWWESSSDGVWARRWHQARESYDNSQLRGVQVSGEVLCTELWRSGYAFELRRPDGVILWECRGGERPVLSPLGRFVAWEKDSNCLVLSDGAGNEAWRYGFKEQIRLKRVAEDGACVILEGRCLRRFSAAGKQGPELWLKEDAAHAAWGRNGALVLASGRHAAMVSLGGGFFS